MSELQPSEVLFIPKKRRLTHSRLKNEDGQEVLHLFYGELELVFDEPDIAPLGEKLIEVERFRADEAMAWSNDAPHGWEKIRDLLQSLIDQQFLKRIEEATATASETYPPRLGLAPPDREARTFSAADAARCPHLTREAFGHEIDLSNIEILIPIYRIAHPAMDKDGRQVGENNVTPRTLFLDLPTQRKACGYEGSRYMDPLPMNTTAMKHMVRRWPELLSLTEQCRRALVARMPLKDPAKLRCGELHFYSVSQLAAVGYVMVRGENPVPNGELDGGLAAMFRLIDGVRLVTTDVMRTEPGQPGWDTEVNAKFISDFADHYSVYQGNFGVCAGPPALIDEYLKTLTGELPAPVQVEPTIAERLGDLDAALDYGLLGQRVEAAIRVLGASHGLLHDRLREAFVGHATGTRLQELVDAPVDNATYPQFRTDHSLVDTFKLEIDVSTWTFDHAGTGLAGQVDPRGLAELVALDPAAQADARGQLAALFATIEAVPAVIRDALAEVCADNFAVERRVLRVVEREQATLNARIKRAPGRTLTTADLATYNKPRCGPQLYQILADALGVTVASDQTATVVRYGDTSLTFTA
jgi:hypothetical protein